MTTVVKNEFHAPNAGMEWIRIVATFMLFGGIGVGAWVMSQQGYADKAGTVLSAMVVFVITRAWSRGMVGLPKKAVAGGGASSADEDFLKANARAATNVAVARMNSASMSALSAMGLAYGIVFLALREGITAGLTVFNNIWICVMAGLIAGSFVAMPELLKKLTGPFRKDGPQETVVQVQQVPTAPPAPTPVQQPPTAQPAQVPVPAKRVVKRVVRKTEGEN